MTRPTFRLAVLMEWVAALAVGFAVLRWVEPYSYEFFDPEPNPSALFIVRFSALLTGCAVFECSILGWETLRRTRSSAWGLGRWTWAASGLYILVGSGFMLTELGRVFGDSVEITQLENGRLPTWAEFMDDLFGYLSRFWCFGLVSDFPAALVAGAIAIRMARWPRDPAPDAREWSGRCFAGLVIGFKIFVCIFHYVFPWSWVPWI